MKSRKLSVGESIFVVSTVGDFCLATIVGLKGEKQYLFLNENDDNVKVKVMLLDNFEDYGKTGEIISVKNSEIYQIVPNLVDRKNNPVCYECHADEIDYPYYSPCLGENLYTFETKQTKNDDWVVGEKVVCENGDIEYKPYCGENNVYYKDNKAYESGCGVCYIPNSSFDNVDSLILSVENYYGKIENNVFFTAASFHEYVKNYVCSQIGEIEEWKGLSLEEKDKFTEKIDKYVWEEICGEDPSVFVESIDLYEELSIFEEKG